MKKLIPIMMFTLCGISSAFAQKGMNAIGISVMPAININVGNVGIGAELFYHYNLSDMNRIELSGYYMGGPDDFSPNAFTKALDQSIEDDLPRNLPAADFYKWLAKMRRRDIQMGVERRIITIKKK